MLTDNPLTSLLLIALYLTFLILPCYAAWCLLRALIQWSPPETSYARIGILTREQQRRMWIVRQAELRAEGEQRRLAQVAAAVAVSEQVTR